MSNAGDKRRRLTAFFKPIEFTGGECDVISALKNCGLVSEGRLPVSKRVDGAANEKTSESGTRESN